MTALAPAHILNVEKEFRARKDRPSTYRFSGVAGDAAHSFGYHVDPNELPGSDYSLQTSRDRAGARARPRQASAWDLSFGPKDMITVTNRLLAAAKAHDPRMKAVREFCGTRDGRNTYPWDLHSNSSEGINSWDDSHLWHVHISFYRDATESQVRLILDVLCGKKMTVVQKVKSTTSKAVTKLTSAPKWPLAPGNYFGPITGPAKCHGGYYASERTYIRKIQLALIAAGCVPGVKSGTAAASQWADGKWEAPTSTAVVRWKRKTKRTTTATITESDWKVLL
jgi:hypothetical protein